MADRPDDLTRVRVPDPARPRPGDATGKRALYSVDPDAHPTPLLLISCPRCGIERGLSAREARSLLRPPWVVNPVTRRMWTRCPTCRRRRWLRLRPGPGMPRLLRR